MLKTFNCGVGFCLITESKNLKKIDKFFSKEYKPYVIGKISENKNLKKINNFFSKEFKPYVIGKISKGKNKVRLNGSINWLQ